MHTPRSLVVVASVTVLLGAAHVALSQRTSLLVVTSGSMRPAIRAGDLVVSRAPGSGEATGLAPGTIVTFHAADNPVLITHRIVRSATNASGSPVIITKGDANRTADIAPVRPRDIVGITTRVIPRAGYAVAVLRNRLFLLALAASAVLAHLSVTLVRSARRATTHNDQEEPVT